MKYNELIRPAGVGRKQLAFNTGNVPSPLFEAETALNDAENVVPYIDAAVSVSGLSEAAAYSAATATQKAVENFVFEIDTLTDFAFVGVPARFQFGRQIITNPYITYDPRTQYFTCRKPGFYLVKMFVNYTGVNGNYDWYVSMVTESNQVSTNTFERVAAFMDFHNVYKHCQLNGTAIFNVPTQTDGGFQGERRFSINIGTSHTGLNVLTNANTKLDLQIIYLGALTMSERATYIVA